MDKEKMLLEIEGLSVKFRMYEKGLKQKELQVIYDLSLNVKAGEIVAVAGSSGSGKSLLVHAVLGILPSNANVTGRILYDGELMTKKRQLELVGKEIVFVPQSVSYLDPLMKIGKQVLGIFGTKERQRELFRLYDLNEDVEKMYPFQISGGMARRVLISMATMNESRLIIADEPTPGLNHEMAEETMTNFRHLADQGCGILLITHDIDLAFSYADRVAVFYAGTTVETAPVQDFRDGPAALRHPYSKALWEALPQNGFKPLPGVQPYAGTVHNGCLFADRCDMRTEKCGGDIPVRKIRDWEVKCIHAT